LCMPKFMATLKEAVARKGGNIVYSTKAKQLIIDSRGRVSGVRALDDDGLRDFMAGAVVLATGGYASNRELLDGFVDPNSDAMVVRGDTYIDHHVFFCRDGTNDFREEI